MSSTPHLGVWRDVYVETENRPGSGGRPALAGERRGGRDATGRGVGGVDAGGLSGDHRAHPGRGGRPGPGQAGGHLCDPGLARREEDAFGRAARALAAELGALLGLEPGAPALVVGLGNRAITPDNIGPKAADQTMVTRHLVERVPEHFGSFRPVAALAAGVLGTTGMESGEVVRAVAEQIKPACVVAVDALASRSLRRVCRTIQLADTGITPGSGVGNARAALNAETLGVPVIAVGVPTVVDAATLTCDVLAEAGKGELNPAALQGAGDGLIVTPKDIDTQVHDLAKVIGYGINLALHTGLTIEDVELFLS